MSGDRYTDVDDCVYMAPKCYNTNNVQLAYSPICTAKPLYDSSFAMFACLMEEGDFSHIVQIKFSVLGVDKLRIV